MNRDKPTGAGHAPHLAVLLTALLAMTACDGGMADMPDAELQDNIYECDSTSEQSPGMAIACDNYRRECRNRRDQGRFVC